MAEPIPAPSPLLLALEMRAGLEVASLVPALPILRRAPRGDGHPVLVLPGYLASDVSTIALRWFLRDRGYRVHAWRLGRNLGPTAETVSGLAARFQTLRARAGRPLSLVGWSLGGIYARELARRSPDDVRQVITLASPFRDPRASNVGRLAAGRDRAADHPPATTMAQLRAPLPVPTTAIYSRTDGIVAWQSCRETAGPRCENVEVESSHCGLGHHPAALLVIADRLAQPADGWRPFTPRGWSRWPGLAARIGAPA